MCVCVHLELETDPSREKVGANHINWRLNESDRFYKVDGSEFSREIIIIAFCCTVHTQTYTNIHIHLCIHWQHTMLVRVYENATSSARNFISAPRRVYGIRLRLEAMNNSDIKKQKENRQHKQ